MLETRAIVIRVEGREALVESLQGGGCGQCNSEKGCGSGKLSQLFSSAPRRFRVRNDANAQVGTVVQIALAEGLLLRSALLMYMLPLLLLLCGAMAGAQFTPHDQSRDVYSAIGGLLGLTLGFVIVKIISLHRNLSAVAQPIILPSAEMSLRGAD